MNIATLRRDYGQQQLQRQAMPADPLQLFEQWLGQACDAELPEPDAMVLATVDAGGRPSQRQVVLKHYDQHGFAFFTSRASRKAVQINARPSLSLLLGWLAPERQAP